MQGQEGHGSAGAGLLSSSLPLLLVTMVMLPVPDLPLPLPLPDLLWTQSFLLSLLPPLATSSAEPGGVPGAVHGGQVPCQQAGSEDQGAGDTPGVRKDPSEASGGGFSFVCKPSRAALVAGATHAPKGCASQGHS